MQIEEILAACLDEPRFLEKVWPRDIVFTNLGLRKCINPAESMKAPGMKMRILLAEEYERFYPEAYEPYLQGADGWRLLGFELVDNDSEGGRQALLKLSLYHDNPGSIATSQGNDQKQCDKNLQYCRCELISQARRLALLFTTEAGLAYTLYYEEDSRSERARATINEIKDGRKTCFLRTEFSHLVRNGYAEEVWNAKAYC